MKDPIFMRTGSCAALMGLFALTGPTSAMAQDPPRRILRPIVVPAPAPAPTPSEKEVRADGVEAPAPAPAPRKPGQIRRVAPVATPSTPVAAPGTSQIRRTAPLVTAPVQTMVAPRRRPPVITSPAPETIVAPDTSRVRRVPPVVATPPAPPPTGPVKPRRAPPVITSPTPDANDPPPADIRRRSPIITTPGPAEVRRRPVVTSPDDSAGNSGAPSRPTTVGIRPVRPLSTPVRPRPGDVSKIPASVIIPPPDGQTPMLANSTTLRPGSYGDMVGRLPVVRQIPAAALRSNPLFKVGKMKVDFAPVLKNPQALINIATKLRAMPDLVEVRADVLEAVEVQNGLVVHNVLTYDFKPGACSDRARRDRIARAGISCFTQSSEAELAAAFANPRDARYVRDPRERARALAYTKAHRGQMDSDIAGNVGSFRGQLSDPAQRAELAAEVGDAEVARLAALDDTALAGELINNNETKVEQVTFLPSSDPVEQAKPAPSPPPVAATPDIDVSYPIGDFTYLTGFTLGRQYEWKQRVETTIKWCLVGCKKSYYAEVFAGFTYGFGLRFPIRLGGAYNYRQTEAGKQASLTTSITTINGNADDYTSTGLASDQLYDGKELVAQFTARAGVGAKLPLVGQVGPFDIPVGFDFTTLLPGDFANGQFTPPQPGKAGPSAPIIFEQADLLGGRGNYGILGAQVFPAVDLTLTSDLLTLTLRDKNKKGDQLTILNSGTTSDVPLVLDPADDAVNFAIEDPKYNLTFKVTPGLDARLFIDLAVWGTKWDWLVWFPQLAIELPPGGLSFACHDGTVCSHDFRFKPSGAQSEFMGRVEKWGRDYDGLWVPKCLDATCEFGIKLSRQSVVFSGKAKDRDNPNGNTDALFAEMNPLFVDARKRALTLIADSQSRKSGALSNAMGILAQAIWTKQCKDGLCFDNVTALAAQMGPRGAEIGKANPSLGTTAINQQVNKEFVPTFRKEIDDSKLREAAAQAQLIAGQTKQFKQPKLVR